MKVGLQTWVLSKYRENFLESLASALSGQLSVYAGDPPRAKRGVLNLCQGLTCGSITRRKSIHLFSGPSYICLQPGLLRWLEREDPDLLVLSANPRFLLNILAARWMKKRGRPVVGWGVWPPKTRRMLNPTIKSIWRRNARLYDTIVTYSYSHASQITALGIPSSKVFVAPNSVLPPPKELPKRATGEYPLRILFVGRLEAVKKVDLLIRAAAIVNRPLELWIVGDGPQREYLKALAADTFPNTRFFGAQYEEDLHHLYRSADLFVMPGSGGLAVQEALHFGLPIIVGPADGSQLDLVNSSNGWHLRSGIEADLASLLSEASSAGVELLAMGKQSYELAKNKFNLDAMLAGFLSALNAAR